MVDEVRRTIQGNTWNYGWYRHSEYAKCVAISTKGAQKEMLIPFFACHRCALVTGVILGVSRDCWFNCRRTYYRFLFSLPP